MGNYVIVETLDAPATAPESVGRGDADHAARNGAVQILTISCQALMTASPILLARLLLAPINRIRGTRGR